MVTKENKKKIIFDILVILLVLIIIGVVVILKLNNKSASIDTGTHSILNNKYYISSTDYENKDKSLVYDKEINYKELNNSSTYYEITNGQKSINWKKIKRNQSVE